jgi:Divergent InlB B-repeat domain
MLATIVGTPASASSDRALHGKIVVGVAGDGEGRIGSSPGGINCPPTCSFSFISTDDPANYQPVTLGAKAEPGSEFQGFGECGQNTCTIDPIEPGQTYEVNVEFIRVRAAQQPLAVTVTGSGRVTSSPAGINCAPTCSAPFPTDSSVTLAAVPTPGWSFSGWTDACSGTGPCSITMNSPRSVTATFVPPNTLWALSVAAAGGSVASDVPGIACGEVCVGSFGAGVEVTITPAANPVTWGGACSGSGACVVPMLRPRAVTAAIRGARLTRMPVAVGFSGKGSITSTPAGIACGTVCGALFPNGAAFTIRASAAAGQAFAGWSGSCHGVEPVCRLGGKAPAAATAAFVESGTRFPVAVTKAGKGTVKSKPAGIDCGKRCSGSFLAGGTATLQALSKKGWTFVRWSGACKGKKKTCSLEMDGPKSTSATFARAADPIPPRVTALSSTGVRGQVARLRYRVIEAGGRSTETARIFRESRLLSTIHGRSHPVEPDALFYFLPWRVPSALAADDLRFCVTSTDLAGNRGKSSCALLHIT